MSALTVDSDELRLLKTSRGKTHLILPGIGVVCHASVDIANGNIYHPKHATISEFDVCSRCEERTPCLVNGQKLAENQPNNPSLSTQKTDHTRNESPSGPEEFDQYVIGPAVRSAYRAACRLDHFLAD